MTAQKLTENNVDAYYFHQGTATRAYEYLGVHRVKADEKRGEFIYAFRTFAYRANAVEVAGDFNAWGALPLKRLSENGIWGVEYTSAIPIEGMRYKFRIISENGVVLKSDPFARESEWGTHTASIVPSEQPFAWHDRAWLERRKNFFGDSNGFYPSPMNIYEVHLGSWLTRDGACNSGGNAYLNYRDIAEKLAAYAVDMGYTHVELMPIMEHPYDGSWGYQVTGYFSPTSRFGSPDDFRALVDSLHLAGIGVILDWVPAHFPKDLHGLADFDGHRMYEYQGNDRIENENWGTRFFDLGRTEVQSFLVSCAMFWLREYHIDGLRTDAVASMLYLDYDRRGGYWIPNEKGGNENIEAVEFLKKLNSAVFAEFPDVLMIAEESTAWPQVTHPTDVGGLGFNFKWNMGWANDMFDYMSTDPYFRAGKHRELTFPMMYAFSENFILPVSHDEVVHGKRSLLDKMYGGYDDKFAGVRVFLGYMMTHPGKKMMFMGQEFGQFREWDYENQLEWFITDFESHARLHTYVRTLNRFYLSRRELWERDFSWQGFKWVHADRAEDNVIVFRRFSENGQSILCVLNFSAVNHEKYKIYAGKEHRYYRECFNSDSEIFGGKGRCNRGLSEVNDFILELTLPPLSIIILEPFDDKKHTEKMKIEIMGNPETGR